MAYFLSFFMAMTLLPATIQDTAVELAVAAALNGAAMGFYSWGTSPSGGLSALGVFLAILFLFALKEGGAALMRYRARKAREITENENLFYEVSKEEAGTLRVDAFMRDPSARRQEGKEDEAWDDARQLYESTPDMLHKMKPQAAEGKQMLGGLASKYAVANAAVLPSASPPLAGGKRILGGLSVDPGAALYDGALPRESPLGAAVGGGLPRRQPVPPPPGRPPEPEELPYWSGALIYDGLKTDDFFSKPSFETNRPMEKISGPPIASSNNKVYGPGVTASKGGGDVDMDTAAQAAARLGASPNKHLALSDLFPVLSNVFPALETSRSRHDEDEAFGRGQGFGLGRREPNQPHPGAVEREADHRHRRSRHRSVERERRVRDDGGGGGEEGLSRSGGLNNASAVVGDGRGGRGRRLAPLEGRAPGQGMEGDPDVQPSNDDDGDRGGRRRSSRDRHRSHRSGRDRSSRSRDRRSNNQEDGGGGGGGEGGEPSEEAEAAERRRRRKTRSSRGRGGEDYSGPGAQSASSRSEIPVTDSAIRLMQMRSDSALPTVNVLDGIDEHSTSGGGGVGGGDGDFPMLLND
jgi:hypothetical protein